MYHIQKHLSYLNSVSLMEQIHVESLIFLTLTNITVTLQVSPQVPNNIHQIVLDS